MKQKASTWECIKEDFRQECRQSTYAGGSRKVFHALTGPGFQAVFGYRLTHWLSKYRIPFLGMILQRLVEVWTGVSISPKAEIGPGLVIFHFGGVIVNGSVVMGRECSLHHDVTIGNRTPGSGSPRIGDRVVIGAGARLLGELTIGDDVEIGANAVVIESLPARAVAVGIPAHIVRIKEGA